MMNNLYKFCCVCVILCSCSHNKTELNTTSYDFSQAEFPISRWHVIGPFNSDSIISGNQLLNYDFFDGCESLLCHNSFNTIGDDFSSDVFYSKNLRDVKFQSEAGFFALDSSFRQAKNGVAYCSQTILCSEEKEVVFTACSDDGMKIILNGENIYSNSDRRIFSVNADYAFGKLKKGKNEIILKLFYDKRFPNEEGKPWRFSCNLVSLDRYYSFYLKGEKNYLKSAVIPPTFPLEVRNVFHPYRPLEKIEIRNFDNELVLSSQSEYNVELDTLDFGFYTSLLISGQDTLSQDFFYGDLLDSLEFVSRQCERIKKKTQNLKLRNNLDALLIRYHLLLEHYDNRALTISLLDANSKPINQHKVSNILSRTISGLESEKVKLHSTRANPVAEIRFLKKNITSVKVLNPLNNNFEKVKDNNRETCWRPSVKDTIVYNFSEEEQLSTCVLASPQSYLTHCLESKFLFLYSEMRTICEKLSRGEDSFVNVGGTHFRSYLSDVDNQSQYYMVQAPESNAVEQIKRPLIVSVPVAMTQKVHFLKSIAVSQVRNIENTQYLINKMGAIHLMPSARHLALTSTAICEKDILDAIEAVKEDYNIDTTRIYLTTVCGGTQLALNMARFYPDKWAAIGFDEFSLNYAISSEWEKENFPLRFTENLRNMPITLVHEEKSTHTPVDMAYDFIKTAKANGADINFILHKDAPKEMKSHLLNCELIFSSFEGKRLKTPHKLIYSTADNVHTGNHWVCVFPAERRKKASVIAEIIGQNIVLQTFSADKVSLDLSRLPKLKKHPSNVVINNQHYSIDTSRLVYTFNLDGVKAKNKEINTGTVPIHEFFREPFVIVKPRSSESTEELVKEFVDVWQRDFFVKPKVVEESKITKSDIEKYNLVLFNAGYQNPILTQMVNGLPLQRDQGNLTFFGEKHEGSSLACVYVYPNPISDSKYILMFDGELKRYKLDERNYATSGYFDYEIYDCSDSIPKLKSVGYFDGETSAR